MQKKKLSNIAGLLCHLKIKYDTVKICSYSETKTVHPWKTMGQIDNYIWIIMACFGHDKMLLLLSFCNYILAVLEVECVCVWVKYDSVLGVSEFIT